MKTEELQKIALKIMSLESECSKSHNIQDNLSKLEELTKTLTIEDMFEIDNYIMEKLLTK